MPTYYDKKTKTWFCKFYYTDYKGEKKQKKKRGFKLQREAKEFERHFLEQQSTDLNMSFENFVKLYQDDMSPRLKPKTLHVKNNIIEKRILPFFKQYQMNEITAIIIRRWQNELISQNYSEAYLKKINGILNAIFNHATKYYDLKTNPCTKAGSIGSHKSKKMQIYTIDEMKTLLENVQDYNDYTIFSTLFYTGMRKGELFALQKKDIITSPKTHNSYRDIGIPQFLVDIIKQYIDNLYKPKDDDYIFMNHYTKARGRLKYAQSKANLNPEFTLHSFRHSHVSMLIELGYSALMIAERIGDTVETTLKTYSHLYPDKQIHLVNKLDELNNSTKLVPESLQETKKP